jgi:transcriptional regulator with XRE-family HTH domain
MDHSEFESNLYELRRQNRITQQELADAVGVSTSSIRNWEKGRRGLYWFYVVWRLCVIFQCSPRELLRRRRHSK